MPLRRKWTEPSQKAKLAPPVCRLDQAKRVQPAAASPAQQVVPPAYLVLIGQLGRPMTVETPTLGAAAESRPAQTAPVWLRVSRSPIMIVLLVPSVIDSIGMAEPPSQICSLTA